MDKNYFKLAAWVKRFQCFRDGKTGYATEADARLAAMAPGRYRISTVTRGGRVDGEPFVVEVPCGGANAAAKARPLPDTANRPMSGRPH